MAEFIYGYLGRHMKNHLITFSGFLNFVREFQLGKANQQATVFRMISDRKKELTITCLTRNLVNTPQDSAFANELKKIMYFYCEKTIKSKANNKNEMVYDVQQYTQVIGTSCLCAELHDKLVVLPYLMYDEEGEPNRSFEL